jgi:hypothetical protein
MLALLLLALVLLVLLFMLFAKRAAVVECSKRTLRTPGCDRNRRASTATAWRQVLNGTTSRTERVAEEEEEEGDVCVRPLDDTRKATSLQTARVAHCASDEHRSARVRSRVVRGTSRGWGWKA